MQRVSNSGFNIIELMVILAVISILLSVVYPLFIDHTTKSRRTDAIVALGMLSMEMEKFYAINNTYAGATLGNTNGDIYATKSNKQYYNLAIDSASTTDYTLKATVNSTLAQKDDSKCYNFYLKSSGVKSSKDSYDTSYTTDCW